MSGAERPGAVPFRHDESGSGTVLGLFSFVIVAVILGLMVDGTFGWRNETYLTSVTDIAAHAGAVAYAEGKTEPEIRAAIADVVEANLPRSLFGNVLDATTDIAFVRYDPATGTYGGTGPDNTVVVRLEQSRARGNPVGTFLLRLAGVWSFDTRAVSAAVYDVNADCHPSDGIYARGKVTLTSQTDVGSGFCVHSEEQVWLPQQNVFRAGSLVTMTNLELCGNKCTDAANPGIVARESHMVLPDYGQVILNAYADFDSGTMSNPVVGEFFAMKPTGDQSPLIAAGIIAGPVSKGSVVTLTQAEFQALPQLPSGLTYKVTCPANGSGQKTWLTFSGTTGVMEDAALITNCALDFEDGSTVRGSVVITTRDSTNATVKSSSSVTVADPSFGCDDGDRTVLMSLSKVSVPAEFVMSNVTLIVDDDVDIASATSGAEPSTGFAIHASGRVQISSLHTFRTCGGSSFLTPEGKVLRMVAPPGY